MIAESIIGAAQEMTLSVPLVVRLQGTNSAEGLKLVSVHSYQQIGPGRIAPLVSHRTFVTNDHC